MNGNHFPPLPNPSPRWGEGEKCLTECHDSLTPTPLSDYESLSLDKSLQKVAFWCKVGFLRKG